MSTITTVYITENFERNLNSIELFFIEQDTPIIFSKLIENLFETIIPNLQRFPTIGIDFFRRKSGSIEGTLGIEKLRKELGDKTNIREYITGSYLILYAVTNNLIYLLSIKHHRQLSFNLEIYTDS